MTSQQQNLVNFALQALALLKISARKLDGARYLLTIPTEYRNELECGELLTITFDKEVFQQADESDIEYVTLGSPILNWVIEKIRKFGSVAYAALGSQKIDLEQTSQQLLSSYRVDGGHISVSDLKLVDSLTIQLDYLVSVRGIETRERLVRLTVDDRGKVIDMDRAEAIRNNGMTEAAQPPHFSAPALQVLVKAAEKSIEEIRKCDEVQVIEQLVPKRVAEEKQLKDYFGRMRQDLKGLLEISQAEDERETIEDQLRTVDRQLQQRLTEVEERYKVSSEARAVLALILVHPSIQGNLLLRNGSNTVHLPINLPIYAPDPPPYHCPKSGKLTYHLAGTADGRFVDAEIVAICSESGRRLPKDELITCSATGRQFCPEFITECPITLKPVHTKSLVKCEECLELTSPLVTLNRVCHACRNREALSRSDRRVQRLMERYSILQSWPNWFLSETRDIYSIQLQSTLTIGRLKVRKSDLKIISFLKRNRILGAWKQASLED